MKIEIVKHTQKHTGLIWYQIHIDGNYVSGSLDRDLEVVKAAFEEKKRLVKEFPEDVYETIEEIEL
jgi:outer membrane protein assembly factor BamD (BamD/ComL family)